MDKNPTPSPKHTSSPTEHAQPYQNIFLAFIAVQQHLPGCQECHVQSCPFGLGKCLQSPRQVLAEHELAPCSVVALYSRSWPTMGQIQHWQLAGQRLSPVAP